MHHHSKCGDGIASPSSSRTSGTAATLREHFLSDGDDLVVERSDMESIVDVGAVEEGGNDCD
jgi:predicted NAD-dependent protein-ADP-ribosyltransferase YbiA (DUF1768 family)